MYNIQVHVPYEKQQCIKKMNHYITTYPSFHLSQSPPPHPTDTHAHTHTHTHKHEYKTGSGLACTNQSEGLAEEMRF